MAYIVSSGEFSSGIILKNDSMTVLDGGTVDSTNVSTSGFLFVSSGGSANSTTVNKSGTFRISGGTANSTTVNDGGRLYIYSGGTANSTTVNSGWMYVSNGGTMNSIAVNSRGYLTVSSGGMANEIIENGGYVYVANGADAVFASNTISDLILSNAYATVHSGTTANNATVNLSGILYVSSCGSANLVTVNSGGSLQVNHQGVVSSVAICSNGMICISSGGILTGRTYCLGGIIYAYDGAIVKYDLTRMNPGACALLTDLSCIQGTAEYTITVKAGQAEGTYIIAENASSFNQPITVENVIGDELCVLTVGKTVAISNVNYTLNLTDNTLSLTIGENEMPSPYTSDGIFYWNETGTVQSGELFHDTMILSGGSLIISDGGSANCTVVNNGGRVYISSSGIASGISVNSGGKVNAYGTVNSIVENGGYVYVADDADATFVANTFSDLVLSSETATVHSGTTANRTTVNTGGWLRVFGGGIANSTTVNADGRLYVSSGGIANSPTVNADGRLYVSSGGTVNSIVENGGYVYVADDADATFVANTFSGLILSSDKTVTVHSGTTANRTTVNSGSWLTVFSGGIANSTTVNSRGWLTVSNGGTANHATVNSDGDITVSSGGTANYITVNSRGWLRIFSGGTANYTTINAGGGEWLNVSSGGTVNSSVVNAGGSLRISNGVVARDTEINGGRLYVSSGGVAHRTTVNAGIFDASSGGSAVRTTVNSGGGLLVHSGGVAIETIINKGGNLCVSCGGTADVIFNPWQGSVVSSNGAIISYLDRDAHVYYGEQGCFVSKADVMEQATITSGNSLIVYSGGIANNATIDPYGFVQICEGGSATDIIWTPCVGSLWIEDGAFVTFASQHEGVYYGNGSVLFSNAMIMENISVGLSQVMYLMSNGLANSTTVIVRGSMFVSSGGTANNTTVDSFGSMCVASGGTAAHIEASSGAYLDLSIAPNTYIEGKYADSAFEIKDGSATYYSVNSGSILRVSSGGVASRTYVYAGGNLFISKGGAANRTVLSSGAMSISSGGIATSTTINYGSAFISSGATADTVIVNNGALYISSGGMGTAVVVNNPAGLYISSGAMADNVTVNNSAWLIVSSGGTATNIIASSTRLIFAVSPDTYVTGTSAGVDFKIKDGVISGYGVETNGNLNVFSGGTANRTSVTGVKGNYSSGCIVVFEGGVANNTLVNAYGEMCISSGARADYTSINSGSMLVSSGGTATGTFINNGGKMWLCSGGMANDTTINYNGSMCISSGGVTSNFKINSGGYLSVEQAKLTGNITIEDGGVIHAGQGTVIDFDISRLAPNMGALLNNLSLIQDDAPAFTLTVSDLQWNGTYTLAKGVIEFDNLISVKSTASQTIHMVAVDETVNVDGVEYTLNLTGDTLSVTVTGGRDIPIVPVSADITEFTNQDVTLTAGFSDDAIMREYSFDNETWHVYAEPVKCTVNGTVYFLGKDQRGYVNEIGNYEVTNIDTMPPSIPGDQASEINGYTADLSWSAASDTGGGAITYEYRIATDNTYSQNLKSGTTETCSITVDNLKSGTCYWSVCAKDAAGNASEWSESKTFTTVDTVAPDIPANLVCLVENITTLSVSWDEASDDSLGVGLNRYEIQLASDEAFDSVVKSFSTTETAATVEALSKGDYYLRVCSVDNAGNKSDWTAAESFTIETDTIPPTISDIKADITEPTKENVTVTATFNDNYALETSQYKIGKDGAWTDYKNGVIVTENAVVYFRAVDTTGNETEASYEVKNIDRTKPVITLDGDTQTPVQQTALTATVDDGSAILYRINNSGEWTAYTGTIAVLANASYSFKATDAAGNTGTAEITFENIDTTPPVLL